MDARRAWAVVLLLALALPTAASAHPKLVGPWVGQGATLTEYDFGPGEYVGNGMWRGPLRVVIGGCVTSYGDYYLRVYHGSEATLAVRDGLMLSTRVGNVDLREGVFDFMGVVYRR